MVFDRHRVGRSRTPRPDHGHSHPGGARFHPHLRPRILDRQRLEPRPSLGLRGGPVCVRDARDAGARPPVRSPNQPGHRDLPLRALASVAADPTDIRRRTARRGPVRRVWIVGDIRHMRGHAVLVLASGPSPLRLPTHLPGKSNRDGQVHRGRHPRGHDHPDHLRGVAGGPPRGPGQSARGRLEPRRHPLGDDACGGPAVRSRGDLRGDHPRPRTGGRRDDGRHDDDREPQRDFNLALRPGTDHRELDREQLPERHRPAGAECSHRTGTRPDADVAPHQRLRATDAGPGPPTRGGRRVMFRFDPDTRRRWKDVAMNVAAFLCVVLALIPLGSLLFEASVRGLRSITPGFFTLTTANGGIGNAIQGTLILIALTAVIALPVGILTGIYLAEYGKNRLGAAVRFFVDVMTQIPSIVVGIFAFSLILELGATGIVSPRLVFSTTTGVIALSTIMIPFVARTSEEALRLVPISTRESALALGIPRYRAILRVVLPSSSSAVITGALLGIARVGGETAPRLMTCLGSPFWWQGLDQPCESLPHTIYVFALGPDSALN